MIGWWILDGCKVTDRGRLFESNDPSQRPRGERQLRELLGIENNLVFGEVFVVSPESA
jgi:hypothetical protein